MVGLDSRTLEPGQDIWYRLREQLRYRQEELPGDSLQALRGLVKQRYLDVRGAAG